MDDNKELNVYQKIALAQRAIKESKLKKRGKNKFADANYYLPEDVSNAVYQACENLNIFNQFELKRSSFGIFGELTVINLDVEDDIAVIEMATDLPPLKGDNASMRYGAAVTFCKRYILQNVYEITDDSLDLNLYPKPEKKQPPVPPPARNTNSSLKPNKNFNKGGMNYGDFKKMNESERCQHILQIIDNGQEKRAKAALEFCKEHKLLSDKNIIDLKSFFNLDLNN